MRVSVLVPVHNGEDCLERAVESALTQTHSDVEVLIVDDGSTDDTPVVADRLARSDSRVVVLGNPSGPSGGSAAPRNLALARATGELIALLDDDDYWMPQKLEAQIAALRGTGAAAAYSRAFIEENGEREDYHDRWGVCPWDQLPCGDVADKLALHNFVPTVTCVARRSLVLDAGGFNEAVTGVDDWYLWLQLAFRGGTFTPVDDHLAVYSWHATNISKQRALQLARHQVHAFEHLRAQYPERRDALDAGLRDRRRHLGAMELRQVLNGRLPPTERLRAVGRAARYRAPGDAWRNVGRLALGAAHRRARQRSRRR